MIAPFLASSRQPTEISEPLTHSRFLHFFSSPSFTLLPCLLLAIIQGCLGIQRASRFIEPPSRLISTYLISSLTFSLRLLTPQPQSSYGFRCLSERRLLRLYAMQTNSTISPSYVIHENIYPISPRFILFRY